MDNGRRLLRDAIRGAATAVAMVATLLLLTVCGNPAYAAADCVTSATFMSALLEQTDELRLNVVFQGEDARKFLAKDGAPESVVSKSVVVEIHTLKLKAPKTSQLALVIAFDRDGCMTGHRLLPLKPQPSA